MTLKNRPDDETLHRLYTDEFNTVEQIAAMYNCGATTAYRWLCSANVETMHRKRNAPTCNVCGTLLDDTIWTDYNKRSSVYMCNMCIRKRDREWTKKNPGKAKLKWERAHRAKGHISIRENKSCSGFLGVYVAERVLSKVFKDVEKMPINNPGYDFICNHGKKIDVKAACLGHTKEGYSRWTFRIRKNKSADYFLLLAFDDRTNLTPLYLWLIPGNVLNTFFGTTMSPSTIDRWGHYRLPIDGVTKCCDYMKR